jgi:CRISPR-associated protein Csd2
MSTVIQHRYDFVYLFDVTDGNPNGDPDAGNFPRVDAETGQGLVTDVCLKRKVRNYVTTTQGEKPGFRIFIKEKAVLNSQIEAAYRESDKVKAGLKAWLDWQKHKKLPKPERHFEDLACDWMCENFYDVRTFGAVMTTGDEKDVGDGVKAKIKMTAGQVRGPVQLTMARSISPVFQGEFAITRCAVTNERDMEKERTIGRKFSVPYGLYRGFGYINATLAERTLFDEADLELFKQALNMMFENDRSAARGLMRPVRCIGFRHDSKLGNARADQLFSRVGVELRDEVKADKRPPRSSEDYEITISRNDLPRGVTVEEWI